MKICQICDVRHCQGNGSLGLCRRRMASEGLQGGSSDGQSRRTRQANRDKTRLVQNVQTARRLTISCLESTSG